MLANHIGGHDCANELASQKPEIYVTYFRACFITNGNQLVEIAFADAHDKVGLKEGGKQKKPDAMGYLVMYSWARMLMFAE